ncbi:MAG: hypothetical protein PWR13_234 [Archaeoglobi archaeon]|nr:GIY-YIG nuclease family protein [Candidatus Mnemosynella sp.]MBC7114888.1 GIY-YIG nuclease family protein [Candidatus Mnemosynella bozhongmuii]MDI3502412.1 hypothetical protein [Archaeoglobi archaeon]MDK2781206.1 hypothetical protein [Archaeoglobi archaeon]
MRENLTYSLLIPVRASELRIGALGTVHFPEGCYVYVGSSMKYGLRRILRHFSKEKKLRWHIDYLLKNHTPSHVIFAEVHERMECEVARRIGMKSSDLIPNFGSSDCSCPSHLFRFRDLEEALRESQRAYSDLGLRAQIFSSSEFLQRFRETSRL